MSVNPRWEEPIAMNVENYAVHHQVPCTSLREPAEALTVVDLVPSREYFRRNPDSPRFANTKTLVWTLTIRNRSWLRFPRVICRIARCKEAVRR